MKNHILRFLDQGCTTALGNIDIMAYRDNIARS